MPERIPQSVTLRVPLQAFLSSDHVSPATGKTIAITISKNGAAYANPSGGATNAVEIGSGSYYVDLSTTDTGTTGPLFVLGTVTGVDNVVAIYNVVNPHNAGFDGVPNATAAANGGLPTVDAANGVKVSVGTSAGQINASSGKVPATLASTDVTGNVASDVQTIKTQTVTCSGPVTVPAATLASTTNITAGTITTVTNLTNAPTAGDFTATMKTSLNAATPASITGNVGGSVVGDVQGKVLGGGASAFTAVGVQSDVEQWKGGTVPATDVTGVPLVDIKYSAGTQVYISDGTLASATATTVTFPTTDSGGNTIPDDARFAYVGLRIVAGTGIGQTVLLTAKNGVRTFNILSGTCPVLLDATSQYTVLDTWRTELELWLGSAPNALISGRVDSNTQATAASLAYNLTGNITGNLSGTVTTTTNLTNLPSIPANWLTAAGIAAGALNGKGDWLLASSAPTNFGSLAITVGGAVTAGTVSDKTGYALSSAGLDSVTIETSLNARQALSIIAAANAGVLAGAATTSITIAAAGVPATNRVTATVDSNGNRSAVTLNPPA